MGIKVHKHLEWRLEYCECSVYYALAVVFVKNYTIIQFMTIIQWFMYYEKAGRRGSDETFCRRKPWVELGSSPSGPFEGLFLLCWQHSYSLFTKSKVLSFRLPRATQMAPQWGNGPRVLCRAGQKPSDWSFCHISIGPSATCLLEVKKM